MRSAKGRRRLAIAAGTLCLVAASCASDPPTLRPTVAAAVVPTAAPQPTAAVQQPSAESPSTPLAVPDTSPPDEYVLYNETAGFRGNEPGNELVLASFDDVGTPTVWHTWPNGLASPEGSPAYLTDQGYLLVAGASSYEPVFDNLPVGSWSTLRLLDAAGDVVWDYTDCDAPRCLHHDIEPLPNGNVLAFVYYRVSSAVAATYGLDVVDGLWMDEIVELRPIFGDAAVNECDGTAWCTDVVWTWDPADHVVLPDSETERSSNSVERIDLRSSDGGVDGADPIHFNGIDYNADLDQIAVSSFSMSEIYIIDHTESGEILYRWGRPSNYDQAGADVFGHQHDPHWIDGRTLSVMNNNSPPGELSFDTPSEVVVLALPRDGQGRYELTDGRYGPDQAQVVVDRDQEPRLNAPFMSGATVRTDGSALVSLSLSKELASFDNAGQTEWVVRVPGPGGQIWKAQVLDPTGAAVTALVQQTGELEPELHRCTIDPERSDCQPITIQSGGESLEGEDRSAPTVVVEGAWTVSIDRQGGPAEQTLEIVQDGDSLDGFLGTQPISGWIEGNVVAFDTIVTTPLGELPAVFELVALDQSMSGTVTIDAPSFELPLQQVLVSRDS